MSGKARSAWTTSFAEAGIGPVRYRERIGSEPARGSLK
jgi:hypothetical protein